MYFYTTDPKGHGQADMISSWQGSEQVFYTDTEQELE